jgi:hypothetical protein
MVAWLAVHLSSLVGYVGQFGWAGWLADHLSGLVGYVGQFGWLVAG